MGRIVKELFERFRPEQVQELIEYFQQESQRVSQELIAHVRNEEFTKASMSAGELDLCKTMMNRGERYLKKWRENNA